MTLLEMVVFIAVGIVFTALWLLVLVMSAFYAALKHTVKENA